MIEAFKKGQESDEVEEESDSEMLSDEVNDYDEMDDNDGDESDGANFAEQLEALRNAKRKNNKKKKDDVRQSLLQLQKTRDRKTIIEEEESLNLQEEAAEKLLTDYEKKILAKNQNQDFKINKSEMQTMMNKIKAATKREANQSKAKSRGDSKTKRRPVAALKLLKAKLNKSR